MSTTAKRMPLAQAQDLAQAIVQDLAPGCTRIEVAGSIRRRKPDVGDIEIVAIPAERPKLILGLPASPLDELLEKQQRDGLFTVLKSGPKYKQFYLRHSDINVELHLCTPLTWGLALVIWTGPQEFSKSVVRKRCLGGLLPDRMRISGLNVLFERSNPPEEHPPSATEQDVFAMLGIPFIEPWER